VCAPIPLRALERFDTYKGRHGRSISEVSPVLLLANKAYYAPLQAAQPSAVDIRDCAD